MFTFRLIVAVLLSGLPAGALAQEPDPLVLDPDRYMEVVDVEEDRPDAVFQLDVRLPPIGAAVGSVPLIAPSGEWVYVRQDVVPLTYEFSKTRFFGGLSVVAGGGWLIWNDVRGDSGFRWNRAGPAMMSAVFGLWQMSQARRVLRLPVDAVVQPAGVEFQRVFEW